MILAPTTQLTASLLKRDATAYDVGMWVLETTTHGRKSEFTIVRNHKLYSLYVTFPEVHKIGSDDDLQTIVDRFNLCIKNGNLQQQEPKVPFVHVRA